MGVSAVFDWCSAASAMGAAAAGEEGRDKKKDQKVVVTGTPVVQPAEPPADSTTEGSVTVGGEAIAYKAVAGTLDGGVDRFAGRDCWGLDGKMLPDTGEKAPDPEKPEEAPATARMFYVAYFKKDAPPGRPVMFLYNGGPGSASMWLHMGSFGPTRVVTTDAQHDEGAPYKIVNNDYSLLDVTRCRVHRCAGHRVQPDHGQGQREGVLGGGPGCACVRPVHPQVSDEV